MRPVCLVLGLFRVTLPKVNSIPGCQLKRISSVLPPKISWDFVRPVSTSPIKSQLMFEAQPNQFVLREPSGAVAKVLFTKLNGIIEITETFVTEEHRGRGLGSKVVKAVLEYCVSQKQQMVVSCDFFKDYVKRNPDPRYLNLISAS